MRGRNPAADGPVLRAALDPAGEVTCQAGEIVVLHDDDLVAALRGEGRRRGHRIELAGRRIERRGPAARVRAGMAVVHGTEVAPDVTVCDHLVAAVGRRRAASLLADLPQLAGRGDDPAGVLSGGERRLLGWLLARAADPTVVLLDRAGTGLDEVALAWAHRVIDGWLDDGVAVLVRPGRAEEQRWVEQRADGQPRVPPGRV